MRVISKCGLLALCVGVVCAFGGCTRYRPQSHYEVSVVKAELEGKNFALRKLGVQGTAATVFLFGTNDASQATGLMLGDGNIQERAMRDLVSQADLVGKAAFLHNVNTEWTNTGIPLLFTIHRLTVTADVVEFNADYVDYKQRD